MKTASKKMAWVGVLGLLASVGAMAEEREEFASELEVFPAPGEVAASTAPKQSSSVRLSRVNVLAGGFVELDLEILEMKVLPYVEFRFNRRK